MSQPYAAPPLFPCACGAFHFSHDELHACESYRPLQPDLETALDLDDLDEGKT